MRFAYLGSGITYEDEGVTYIEDGIFRIRGGFVSVDPQDVETYVVEFSMIETERPLDVSFEDHAEVQ